MTLKPESQVVHLSELCSSPLTIFKIRTKVMLISGATNDLVIPALCPHLPYLQPGAFAVPIPCQEFSCLRKISEAILLVKKQNETKLFSTRSHARIHILCICESEAGGLRWVQGQLRLQRDTCFHEHHQQQTPPGQTKLPLTFSPVIAPMSAAYRDWAAHSSSAFSTWPHHGVYLVYLASHGIYH